MKDFAKKLLSKQVDKACNLPNRICARSFVDKVLELLFPHFSTKCYETLEEVELRIESLEVHLQKLLKPVEKDLSSTPLEMTKNILSYLPSLHEDLLLDAKAMYEGDPAAILIDEVIISYPGFFAIATHRIANIFVEHSIPFFPRIMSEYAHELTGIDIHPGANIGKSFCIDHGTGIVIGETSKIGNNVKIYQGVTLGALSVDKSMAQKKRHPTLEDNVVVYANATILGGETVIGKGSVVGGNVWITESVSPNSKVYYKNSVCSGK